MHCLVKIYAAPWVCERMFWFANPLWLANFHLHCRQKNIRNELDYINLSGLCRSQPHGSLTLILKVTTLKKRAVTISIAFQRRFSVSTLARLTDQISLEGNNYSLFNFSFVPSLNSNFCLYTLFGFFMIYDGNCYL